MYVNLKDEFYVNNIIYSKQVGYLIDAIGQLNVLHFKGCVEDNVGHLLDSRKGFNINVNGDKYNCKITQIEVRVPRPDSLTFKIRKKRDDVYQITFWYIFDEDKMKVTSSMSLYNLNDPLEKLIRSYDKDLRELIPDLKRNLMEIIKEVIDSNKEDSGTDPTFVYVLMNDWTHEVEAISSDRTLLEKLEGVLRERIPTKPNPLRINTYNIKDFDSYLPNIPIEAVYIINYNGMRLGCEIMDIDDEIAFVNENGLECQTFIDKKMKVFYCRAKSSDEALIEFHKANKAQLLIDEEQGEF